MKVRPRLATAQLRGPYQPMRKAKIPANKARA
jgi:hypothetical protein